MLMKLFILLWFIVSFKKKIVLPIYNIDVVRSIQDRFQIQITYLSSDIAVFEFVVRKIQDWL